MSIELKKSKDSTFTKNTKLLDESLVMILLNLSTFDSGPVETYTFDLFDRYDPVHKKMPLNFSIYACGTRNLKKY